MTIERYLERAARAQRLLERHASLVAAFIAASELVQGIADAEFTLRGLDARSEAHDAGMTFLVALARCIDLSWRSGFKQCRTVPIPESLRALDPSRVINAKCAEGYAYYAVYPESYLAAASRSGLGSDTQVIGIRSIGTGLSALVAAALGARPPVTVRPVGHPFRRNVQVDPALTKELTASDHAVFAIVDEGPGLSGSSFGAVAKWLEENGVGRDRIHFFPSHAGDPGPESSGADRERWSSAARHVVSVDELSLDAASPQHHLSLWLEELLGPLDGPLEDLSGGAWRERRYSTRENWPAVNIQQERQKFLAHSRSGCWLVKFAGLGEVGEQKLHRARLLQSGGFVPEAVGFCHGFLVEKWHDSAPSLDQVSFDRRALVEQIGAYLGFRARRLRSTGARGASVDDLHRMAVHNTGKALGEDVSGILGGFLTARTGLDAKVRCVDTDNRMHAWEWLVVGGRLVKADALDHSSAHDLVGHQDITWDIAGAICEFDLTEEEAEELCTLVCQRSGAKIEADLLAVMHLCYLAFQLGTYVMSKRSLGNHAESVGLERMAEKYASLLETALGVVR